MGYFCSFLLMFHPEEWSVRGHSSGQSARSCWSRNSRESVSRLCWLPIECHPCLTEESGVLLLLTEPIRRIDVVTLTNLLPFPTLGLGSFSTLGLRFPSTWIFKCSSFFFQRWLEAFQFHALSASIGHLLFSAEGRVSPASMAQTT